MELNDLTIRKLALPKGANIYFIGIGGSSMSGLALISKSHGYHVSGSDSTESAATKKLVSAGISVIIGHSEANVPRDTDLAVYTLAVAKENPERLACERLGIPVVERGIFLGYIASHFSKTAAIAGVHGKTTTTSMVTTILSHAGKRPGAHIGGVLSEIGSNVLVGSSDYFVTEACEYHNNFLHLSPFVSTILNLEPEHLDWFKTYGNMKEAFYSFGGNLPRDGYLVLSADSKDTRACGSHTKAHIITYSLTRRKRPQRLKNALGEPVLMHFNAENCRVEDRKDLSPEEYIRRGYSFTLMLNGEHFADVTLNVPGLHNVMDAMAAAAVALSLGCTPSEIKNGLEEFKGTGRRYEYVGKTAEGAFVVSDYAHHPSEIKITLDAAGSNAPGKLLAVFQPHLYSRANRFKQKFPDAVRAADKVIITDIFAAREKDNGRINSARLCDIMLEHGIDAEYVSDFNDVASRLLFLAGKNDMIMLLGAGSVNKIADLLVEK
ncbi:MAG: UDP-N-acetylmuramate--L-alanine ligase [Clostridia bacterium]|nr:UDP-N-acetylmuramate--L-alanine ligase [Clostridia bacterium]